MIVKTKLKISKIKEVLFYSKCVIVGILIARQKFLIVRTQVGKALTLKCDIADQRRMNITWTFGFIIKACIVIVRAKVEIDWT